MTIEAAFFGSLARDAEAKVSKGGKPYLRFTARVGDGDNAQWVSVMAFDPDAIAAADKFVKGARVYVEGKITLDEWTGQDGIPRRGLSMVSWHCRLSQIGRNKPQRDQQKQDDPPASGRERAARSDYAPAGKADPISTGRPRSADAMSDDIPFAPEVR